MKYLITTIFLFIVIISFGQVAIINDKDGFTNVRTEPNAKSEVIYTLKNNQVFWFGEEDYFSKNIQWVMIEIPKNNYSMQCGALDNLQGYIHKSRIKPLNKIPEYTNDDFKFSYVIKPFSKTNKIITYQNNYILTINGLYPWGTDGGKPKTEVQELIITIKEKTINVHTLLISDLYECTNNFKIYKIDQTFFVHQWNSDGAGAYEIVWVITNNGIKQRLVGSII